MAGKIFINYRRGDDPGHTGRLFDRLQDVFPPEQLFLDVDNIAPGLDFVRVLNDRVAECDIVLAVIGKGWIDSRDAGGNRRLNDPDDFVRIEITSALNQGKRVIPVLVGDAHMPRPEDLPEALQPLARRNAVRLTHERFRADTQGLIKAIQQGLQDIEAERQAQAEAERRAKAEAERRRREEEAARRREEEERAASERRRQQGEAKKRAEAERAFAIAKRTRTIEALDAFLGTNAESPFIAEAQTMRAALVARDEAYRRIAVSDDPAVLRSFVETYKKGADVKAARARLHRLEPRQAWLPIPHSAMTGAVGLVLGTSALLYWLTIRVPEPLPAPDVSGATNESSERLEKSTMSTATETNSNVSPVTRAVDQIAWDLIKATTDDSALRRFIEQYPESALRKDAAARIASLDAAEAARKEAAAKAEVERQAEAARQLEAARIAAQNRALEEERAKAAAQTQKSSNEETVALMHPGASQPGPAPLTGPALIQAIKMELTRVGCYAGALDDEWTLPAVKQSIMKFVKAASLPRVPDEPSTDFLAAIRNRPSRVCPLECAKTEIESKGKCIAKTCPSGQTLDSDGDCQTVKQRTVSRPAQPDTAPAQAKAAAGTGALAKGGLGVSCGRFGCKEHPAVNAPGGLPCKHAWQGQHGGWHCTD